MEKLLENENILIDGENTILLALERLDASGMQILFWIEKRKLIACLTDGDIRKALLAGYSLDTEVKHICNYNPVCLEEGFKIDVKRMIDEQGLRAVPIVNKDREVVKIVFPSQRITLNEKFSEDIPVVMMAGGLGTRLFPYTKIIPKPLIPVADIPISERIINRFCEYGCKNFYMIVNYKKQMIKAYYNELEKNYMLTFVDEDAPLGTGGGLSLVSHLLEDTFILTNCDILIRDNLVDAYNYHKKEGNLATMICSLKNYKIPYGVIEFGRNGQIKSMKEKPNMAFYTNTGCYIIEPKVFEFVPPNTMVGMPEVLENVMKKGCKVGAYPISENSWLDMGEMDTFELMTRELEKNED